MLCIKAQLKSVKIFLKGDQIIGSFAITRSLKHFNHVVTVFLSCVSLTNDHISYWAYSFNFTCTHYISIIINSLYCWVLRGPTIDPVEFTWIFVSAPCLNQFWTISLSVLHWMVLLYFWELLYSTRDFLRH